MTTGRLLEEAVARYEDARRTIEILRAEPAKHRDLEAWLAALTDMVQAHSEVQRLNNESVHEKLHRLAGRQSLSS